jgi:hypothetical protein
MEGPPPVGVDDDREVTPTTSVVDMKRALMGALPGGGSEAEHGVEVVPATEAVDLRRGGGSSTRAPRLDQIWL